MYDAGSDAASHRSSVSWRCQIEACKLNKTDRLGGHVAECNYGAIHISCSPMTSTVVLR